MSSSIYPTLDNIENIQYNGGGYTPGKENEENPPNTFTASAPELVESHGEEVVATSDKVKIKDDQIDGFQGKVCSICYQKLLISDKNLHHSLVVFSKCKHVVHLSCVVSKIKILGEGDFSESEWRQTCADCLINSEQSGGSSAIAPKDSEQYLNYEHEERCKEYLKSFKVRFAKMHNGQDYDKFRDSMASHDLKRYILCGSPNRSSSKSASAASKMASAAISSLVPSRVTMHLTNIASRLRMKRIENMEESEVGDSEPLTAVREGEDDIDYQIRTTAFVDLMFTRNRTFDDVLALEDGNLLQLFRCGVQSYDDLRALGFNPVLHLLGAKTPKVPAWQLHDLYDFTFNHLVGKEENGGFAMPIRDVLDFVDMMPPEWALIGTTAAKLISLQIRKEHTAKFRMTLSQWIRYLNLEPAHIPALGIVNRDDFVELMKWDAKSSLCPLE